MRPAADPVLYHEAWKKLCECEGVLVPGGFGKRGVEGKIAASQWARAVQLPQYNVHHCKAMAPAGQWRNFGPTL